MNARFRALSLVSVLVLIGPLGEAFGVIHE